MTQGFLFSRKLHLAWLHKYTDGLGHSVGLMEGGLFLAGRALEVRLLSTDLRTPLLCHAATAHHPRCLHLDAEQQQASGICPHCRQRPALLPRQGAAGQALREDPNSLPESKSALFLTKRRETSAFFLDGSGLLVCVCVSDSSLVLSKVGRQLGHPVCPL